MKTPLDIEQMVEAFILNNQDSISFLYKKYFIKDFSDILVFQEYIKPFLKDGYIHCLNSNFEENVFKPYLISIIQNAGKQNILSSKKETKHYLCPACIYLNRQTIVYYSRVFRCDTCLQELNDTSDPKRFKLLKVFSVHSKKGYSCSNCSRWIPHPLDDSKNIICPYYDCYFSGPIQGLKNASHPSLKEKIQETPIDNSIHSLSSNDIPPDTKIEIEQEFKNKIAYLKDIIEGQANAIYYVSIDATLMHKKCMYQAFLNMLEKSPEQMIQYLIYTNGRSGLQHKIFQEYISLLEKKFPFSYKKNGKMYRITSLLDEDLNLFDGISVYKSEITKNLSIKNETEEFYIGGRKGTYSQPYYIGKLLDVVNLENSNSLISNVIEYSFSKIKLKNASPGTKVQVSHLRIPPHYQMGGLVHLNRIRKKIVDKAVLCIKNENNR